MVKFISTFPLSNLVLDTTIDLIDETKYYTKDFRFLSLLLDLGFLVY